MYKLLKPIVVYFFRINIIKRKQWKKNNLHSIVRNKIVNPSNKEILKICHLNAVLPIM